MAGLDRRFGPSQREEPIDRPGLVIDDANDTYVITADGVRHLLDGSIDPSSLAIDTIGAGTDIVTNNASLLQHGLLRKLDNDTSHFLNGAGAWTIPAAGGIVPELGWHNVLAYGATGDGVTDDGPAIQAAFDAAHAEGIALGVFAGNPVYFPAGQYKWNATLIWKAHNIIGVSEDAVHCFWGGGNGNGPAISGVTYSQGQTMSGMQFRGGTPNYWVQKGTVDVWDRFMFNFFGQTTIAAIRTGEVVNFHIGPHNRWNLGLGTGVWLNHSNAGSRSFSIDTFTLSEGSVIAMGLLRMTGTSSTSSNLTVRIGNARIEANSGNWPSTSQLILIDGLWGLIPAQILFDSLTCQLDTQSPPPPVIRKDASVDSASIPVITHINSSFGGFGSWAAGTFTYGGPPFVFDPLPTPQRRQPVGM